jgi:hypothetical protein
MRFCQEESREMLLKHLLLSSRHAEAVGAGADMKQVSEEAEVEMLSEMWTSKDSVSQCVLGFTSGYYRSCMCFAVRFWVH